MTDEEIRHLQDAVDRAAELQRRYNEAREEAVGETEPAECDCGGPAGHVPGWIHCRK